MSRQLIGMLLTLGLLLGGGQIRAEQPRIVSTDAAATQILFALGIDSALVGVDVTSTLPEGYRSLPSVGYHRALSAEGLLSLEPSLIIGSEHIGPEKVLATAASAGVDIVRLPSPTSIEELGANVTRVAQATGSTERAQPLLQRLEAQKTELATSTLAGERIAFLLSASPGKLRLAGSGTAGEAFIQLLGGDNVAAFSAYRTLTPEALLELNPSLILMANHEGGSPEGLLKAAPVLRYGDAARAEQVLTVEASNLVAGLSPGAVSEAIALTRHIEGAQASR